MRFWYECSGSIPLCVTILTTKQMIEELQQEIAKLKQKLANVQQQVIEAWEAIAHEQEEHEWTKYYEYGGTPPGPLDDQGCRYEDEDKGEDEPDYVACDECGRLIEGPYCICEDDMNY